MGYITLLSDLGLQDASVAIARGILMQHAPRHDIIDITHQVNPFCGQQAAYLLGGAYKRFPAGTCHIVLFDIFAEKNTVLILVEHAGHYFLCADNGLLSVALHALPPQVRLVATFDKGGSFIDWLHAAADTVNTLQAKLASLPAHTPKVIDQPAIEDVFADCDVIHIDQYENVVLNVTKEQFLARAAGRQFRLQFMQVEEINELSIDYNDVRTGYKLCRFNSNDHLEICINRGRAASLFGLRLDCSNNNIKISFE
jgi:S-adenosylmethionine hydrolase